MRHPVLAFLACTALAAPLHAASVDGIEIQSASAGSGPTLIFVHGWTCDSSSWAAQVSALSDDYRVITLDLPGHGKSGSPADGVFSMQLFARAVEAVRAEAGADKVVLIGHSMGSPVIRQYAVMYPQRVAGLVAVDGPLDVRNFGGRGGRGGGAGVGLTREMRERMIRGMFVESTPPALQEQILATMLGTADATASGAMAAMFNQGADAATVVRAPAFAVVAGTAQVPDPAALEAVVPNFEAVQLAGTGHFLMMEKPAEFNSLLEGFLDRIDY